MLFRSARLALKLIPASAGSVHLAGRDVTALSAEAFRPFRRRAQIIFQDPYSALNPRMTLRRIFNEVFTTHNIRPPEGEEARMRSLLADVGLGGADPGKRPAEFSGGQLQRIGIARALALDPDLIIADEPTSALDPSIQAQILNLMLRIRRDRGVAFLLISHDLEVVAHLADRIAVMYLGRIVEEGPTALMLGAQGHPYSRALFSAAPGLAAIRARSQPRIALQGEPPDPAAVPQGCRFHPRCSFVTDLCRSTEPALIQQPDGRRAACHFAAGFLHPDPTLNREAAHVTAAI